MTPSDSPAEIHRDLAPLTLDEAEKIITDLETAFGWTGELPDLDRRTFYRMAETLKRGARVSEVKL